MKILVFPWIPLVEMGLIKTLEQKKLKNLGALDLAPSVVDQMSEYTPFCLVAPTQLDFEPRG